MKHANLKALFTAIANSIRNKTGGTDAIIADDFPEAIDGIQTGGGVDKIQRYIELNGNKSYYLFYKFRGASVDELMDGVDTSVLVFADSMFEDAQITSVPLFDTSNLTSSSKMFYSCKHLSSLPLYDTRKVTTMQQMFYYAEKLKAIPALDCRSVTNFNYTFFYCTALTECLVRNIKKSLQVSDGTSWGHLLTLESLLHLCKECRKTTSSLKLTVGTANLEKLANVYVKLIDITDDMRAEDDLIDEKYPFVQCESTDEGAMTLQDYMATKMWSLA